jgi:hypothetical protein
MSVAARALPKRAPAIQKAAPLCLADKLGRHMDAISNRHYFPLGFVLEILLGVSDESAYFQDPVNRHLGPITKVQGLTLHWTQDIYPQIAELSDGRGGRTLEFLFPRGVVAPPKIADPRYRRMHPNDPPPAQIPQDLEHFSSGQIYSRKGIRFLVLQPVEYIGIRTCGTLLKLTGRTNPADGTKVAMLYAPAKKLAFLVGGILTFD